MTTTTTPPVEPLPDDRAALEALSPEDVQFLAFLGLNAALDIHQDGYLPAAGYDALEAAMAELIARVGFDTLRRWVTAVLRRDRARFVALSKIVDNLPDVGEPTATEPLERLKWLRDRILVIVDHAIRMLPASTTFAIVAKFNNEPAYCFAGNAPKNSAIPYLEEAIAFLKKNAPSAYHYGKPE